MKLFYEQITSPIGPILIAGSDDKLHALEFTESLERVRKSLESRFGEVELQAKPGFGGFSAPIHSYFAGDRTALDELPVETGGTDFQRNVWQGLRDIGAGRTSSYGELAARLGKPSASRAVGMANSKNPISLVIPCHRVIGANGALTGYAGGLDRKQWLLRHEGALI